MKFKAAVTGLLMAMPIAEALICWECDNAKSMDDCKAQKRARECNSNEKSCQQEIRTWGPGGIYKSITQRCKQKHACVNNHIQNPRAAWKNSQCQPIRHPENSVCRCCCTWSWCNGKEYAGCKGLKHKVDTTIAPTTLEEVLAIGAGDQYGEVTGDNNVSVGESPGGSFDIMGMGGTGGEETTTVEPEPALTTVAPKIDMEDSGNQYGVVEGTGEGFGMSLIQGNAPSCAWGDWTEWDKCSETCGGGQRNRYRNPIGGTIGDIGCEGFGEEVEYCATRDCEDKQCNDAYLDVCFLVHVTDDTKERDFNRIKRFIKSCQNHLGNLGDEDMQFCLYQYNADAEKVISLAESAQMDKKQFQDAVDAMIPLQGSGNSISDALDVVSDNGFNSNEGWRSNNQVPTILVVVTDDLNGDQHYQSFLDVHNKAYRVVAVGVGDGVDNNALNKIASVPVEENTHKILSYDQLIDIAQEVAYDVCQVDHWNIDQCSYENGGCSSNVCYTQYNGKQCYAPAK
jgi:hypothetical protein